MNAVLIERTGPPAETARLASMPVPDMAAGDVRIRMLLAPVNPADLNVIEGSYGKRTAPPCVPGIEGCGVVEAVAAGVCGIDPGRLVITTIGMGCWAEVIVRPASSVVVLPRELDPVQAAMLRVNPATAWGLLHAAGPLPHGAWVVQNAGSSAVGHCVIQLARHLGLRGLTLVRRPESIVACQVLGAAAVLLDDAQAVKAARGWPGFAPPVLGLNAVGGESATRLMDLLARGGTHVTYGAMGREPVKVPNRCLIFQDLRLRGFWVTQWIESAPPADVQSLYQKLAALVAAGKLIQPVAAIYPLTELRAALQHAAQSGRGGKVLLRISSSTRDG